MPWLLGLSNTYHNYRVVLFATVSINNIQHSVMLSFEFFFIVMVSVTFSYWDAECFLLSFVFFIVMLRVTYFDYHADCHIFLLLC
jgi:hypothetical protein